MLRGAIELACKHDMPITALTIYANLADVLLLAGRGDEAMTVVDEGLAMAARARALQPLAGADEGRDRVRGGDWPTARALLAEHGRRLSQHLFVNEAHRRVAFALADGRPRRGPRAARGDRCR